MGKGGSINLGEKKSQCKQIAACKDVTQEWSSMVLHFPLFPSKALRRDRLLMVNMSDRSIISNVYIQPKMISSLLLGFLPEKLTYLG